jgi:hypothetical protein
VVSVTDLYGRILGFLNRFLTENDLKLFLFLIKLFMPKIISLKYGISLKTSIIKLIPFNEVKNMYRVLNITRLTINLV